MQEYCSKFNELIYQIRLYDPLLCGFVLVSHFMLGLKDELRSFVKAAQPTTVTQAYLVALAPEGAHIEQPGKRFYQR